MLIQCPLSRAKPQNQAAGRTRKAQRLRDAEQACVQGCPGAQRRACLPGVLGYPNPVGDTTVASEMIRPPGVARWA